MVTIDQPPIPGMAMPSCRAGRCERISKAKGWRPCDRCGHPVWKGRRGRVRAYRQRAA